MSGVSLTASDNPAPDERYKVDILVVVAHPDDEAGATPYLVRAIDEGKRVAVVYGTRGGSGANEEGTEHAGALADIREMEARNSCAKMGISNVWFLGGKDTASQNVLNSLASWGHGAALEKMVRLVRLTRPEVILTLFPGVFIGENHGDHQAAGVIATEAFDLAGDPAEFSSQVAGPSRRLEPFLENLRPWQPKKIYYFGYDSHEGDFKNAGPSYSVLEMSKSRHMPYWRIAIEAFQAHVTQAKGFIDSFSKMSDAELEKLALSSGWGSEQTFVLGKSLVGGSVKGDIFEGTSGGAIAFVANRQNPIAESQELSVELGGPWSFYRDFRRAHSLENLPQVDPEIAVQAGGVLEVPIWIRNGTKDSADVVLSATLPSGWSVQNGAESYSVRAGESEAVRVEIATPQDEKQSSGTSEVSVQAKSNGKILGTIKIHAGLRKRALPQ